MTRKHKYHKKYAVMCRSPRCDIFPELRDWRVWKAYKTKGSAESAIVQLQKSHNHYGREFKIVELGV